jgi:hypothetical protein
LKELGDSEGKDIQLHYRFADGMAERLSDLTSQLASLGVKVIVTSGTTAIRAAHTDGADDADRVSRQRGSGGEWDGVKVWHDPAA